MYVHFEALNTQLTYFTVNDGDILRYRTKQCEYLQCGDENEMRFIKQWKADTQTHSHIQKCLYRTHIYTHTQAFTAVLSTQMTHYTKRTHTQRYAQTHISMTKTIIAATATEYQQFTRTHTIMLNQSSKPQRKSQ